MAEGENLGRAILALTTDATGIDGGLDAAERKAQGWVGRVGGVLKTGLMVGAGVARAAGAAVTGLLVDAVGAASEAQQITAQLENVLRATGGVAGVSKQAVEDLSNALSLVTPVEDDVITGAQTMLLTFKNISSAVFPETTEAVLDMATAMNRGATPSAEQLQSTAVQLGKAMNDPIAGISALTRVGVTFTDAQKEQIKTLMESGDLLGAQKIILQEVQSEFGGAARAAGTTFAGQMQILNNQLGNVKEQIGTALLPVLSQMATQLGPVLLTAAQGFAGYLTDTLIPAIAQIVTWVTTNWPQISATVQQVFGTVQSIISTVIEMIRSILAGPGTEATSTWTGAWQTAQSIIAAVIPPIQAIIESVIGAINTFLAAHGDEIKAALGGAWQTLGAIVQTVLQIIQATVVPVLTGIATFIQTHGAEIQTVMGNAWTIIKTTVETVLNAILGIVRMVLALVRGDWTGAWTELQTVATTVLNGLEIIVGKAIENLMLVFKLIIGQISEKLGPQFLWLKDSVLAPVASAFGGIGSAIRDVIGWVNDLIARLNAIKMPNLSLPNLGGVFGGLGGGSAGAGQAFSGLPPLAAVGVGSAMGGGNRSYQNTFNVTVNAGGNPDQVRMAVENGVLRAARSMGMR